MNIVYLYNSDTRGACFHKDGKPRRRELQTTIIAKRDGRVALTECGVLVPNPYFGTVGKWRSVIGSIDPGKLPPFDARADTAFWRGSLGDQAQNCLGDQGNYKRFQAASLSAHHPTLIDVKFSEVGSGWNTSVSQLGQCEPYDKNLRAMVGKMDTVVVTTWHKATEYENYKMLVHLSGKTTGSHSRNINHLWATGAAILGWNSTATEWYYPVLVGGVTHPTVYYGDIVRGQGHASPRRHQPRRDARRSVGESH